MVSLVTDYVQNTAAHYLKIGLEAAGTVAGNAVGGVGGLIEDSGKAVANGKQRVPSTHAAHKGTRRQRRSVWCRQLY